MISFNKTKIVATIGPASSSYDILKQLIMAGVDVCRINLSHGDYSHHREVMQHIRKINRELHTNTAILVDLQGPKLRVGEMKDNAMLLTAGEEVIFTTHECIGEAGKIYMNYHQFPSDVAIGDIVLIDDGKLKLRVTATNKNDQVNAIVESGGILSSRKGVNLPRTVISLPSLTKKDLEDLEFALEMEVDWIGLSFVRTAGDIRGLKDIISRSGKKTRVVAKIEKPEALQELDAIINEADALMVARGDLGVELPMEQVPLIQKLIVKKCIEAFKPVIIATQMMESMITNHAPTRAEVNDVANSVLDGADAVMLSGETSVGKYPVQVVACMRNIIATVEAESYPYNRHHAPDPESDTYISDSVCYNACLMGSQVKANAIVGMTRSGYTAFQVSAQRPDANIFIFTDVPSLMSALSLVWGVRSFYYNHDVTTDETIVELQDILKMKGLVKTGEIIINLASIPLEAQGRTNMVKLSRVR